MLLMINQQKKINGIIYKYTNTINNKVYIGKTINENHRKIQHKTSKYKDHFHNAIRKYGFDNFKYNVLFRFKSNNKSNVDCVLNILEKYFIKKYDSYNNGYNSTLGGDGNQNKHLTQQWKNNISKSLLGNKRRKGIKFTEEQRLRLKERKRPTITEESIQKRREKYFKKVFQYTLDGTLINVYKSVQDAAKSLNSNKIVHTGIAAACRGIRKTAYGYKWSYENTINKNEIQEEEQ